MLQLTVTLALVGCGAPSQTSVAPGRPYSAERLDTIATSTLDGETEGDTFGLSVSGAGDVNGDGFNDVIVGAPEHAGMGRAYVYYGSADGLVSPAAVTLSGDAAGQGFGQVVTGGGDLNGDGFGDVAVGAAGSQSETAVPGSVYVYMGSATGLSTTPKVLVGETDGDQFGASVAVVGDIHDDGRDDLAVGAYGYATETGRAYLFSGSSSGLGSVAANTVDGVDPGDRLGFTVGRTGDTGRDGFDDVAISVPGTSTLYVFGGGSFGLSEVRLTVITSTLEGFGNSVSYADVNGDRYSDLLVGAVGTASVFTGSTVGPATVAETTYTGEATMTVVGIGDLDSDGYDEIAVGSQEPSLGVEVYEGSADGATTTSIASLAGESSGDGFGWSVSGAGDVNGDDADDMIVGAPEFDASVGRAYFYKGYDETDADGDTYNATDDCDDANPAVHPGAIEACDAANADEDCNGVADDATATGQSTFYADTDKDNYGDKDAVITACDAPAGYVTDSTDCDDTRYAVHPGATEVCNDLDDNCDGSTDGEDSKEPLVWYEDADGDTYPNPDVSTESCQQPEGFVKLGEDDDCDDNDAATHPYADEIKGDGIDQDCDGADPEADKKCGCANSSASPGWLLGLLALVGLRRRAASTRA